MDEKDFHLETNSAAEDSLSQLNYERQIEATNLIEINLSKILARFFVECWNELKTKPHTLIKIGRSRLATERYDGRKKHFREERCKTVEGTFSARPQMKGKNNLNRYLRTEFSVDAEEEVDRNRYQSVRVVKHHVEESRAKVLQEIVDKLKRNRIQQESPLNKDNEEVLRKINKLEKLMYEIKSENNTKHTKIEEHHIIDHGVYLDHHKKHHRDESRIVEGMAQEIHRIRKEVSEIKLNNESILKLELERSRSQSKNRSRILVEESKADFGTIGVQTNIVKRPLSYTEIEEKHKRLSEEAFYQSKVTPNTNFQSSLATNPGPNSNFSKSYVSLSPLTITIPPAPLVSHSINETNFQPINRSLMPPQSYNPPIHQSSYKFTHHPDFQPHPQTFYQSVHYPTIQSSHQSTKDLPHHNHQPTFIVSQPIRSVVLQQPQQQVINYQRGLNVSLRENSIGSSHFCSTCRRNCQCKPVPLENLKKI